MGANGQTLGLHQPPQTQLTLDWSEGELAALETVEDFLPEQVREGTVLRATDIHKRFGGVYALQGASIEVPAHSFVGLIGPNGSGKSTLFDVLNGFTPPDQGTVEAFGLDVTRKHAWDRAKLGMSRTFQANHIDLDLTVLDNLLAGAYLNVRGGVVASVLAFPAVRADQRRAAEVARAVARLLDLEPVLDVRAGSLNFGAQRRIEIGRSLMSRPRLLLLDEPSAGMDAVEAQHLLMLVKRLQTDLGLAVLLIEHFVRMVLDNCGWVHAIAGGQVIAAGPPDVVAASEAVQIAYLGVPGA
jgi:ABC-type branched-subunit amino acid transport system ATPase component